MTLQRPKLSMVHANRIARQIRPEKGKRKKLMICIAQTQRNTKSLGADPACSEKKLP